MKSTILILLMFFFSISLFAQRVATSDSLEIKNKIENFYSWYATLIKTDKLRDEFNPSFIRASNGMTTLSFTKYKEGLKTHFFVDSLIEKKIKDYEPCLNNLKKIPYSTFTKFEDLDQFEDIKCDFFNVYEWCGGQEPIDGASLKRLKIIKKDLIKSSIEFFQKNREGNNFYFGNAELTFIKTEKGWKICTFKLTK